MLAEQRASALSGDLALRDLNLRDSISTTRPSPKTLVGRIGLMLRRNLRESFSSKSHADSRVLLAKVEHQQNMDAAAMPFHRPVTSQRSQGTMRDALRFPAHRRAPQPETHSAPTPPAGTTLRKCATPTPSPTLRVVRSLPSLRRGLSPLDKQTPPLPRPSMPAGKLDTDMFARPKNVKARPHLGLRLLPPPVYNDIAPLATTCEQGSATREPVVRPESTAPGPIDISPTAHTHVGSDARAGAVDRFRRMAESDSAGLEKDTRELLLLFDSRRDTGSILDVTGSDIASPAGVAFAPFRWPVPRAETTQGHPAAPLPVSAYRGSSKHLQKLEVERDEERSLEALSEKARAKAARLEKDKRDLLSLFVSRRDAGFILDVTGSSPARSV